MVKITADLYWVACTLAGKARRGYLPQGVNLLTAEPKFPRVRKAVYFVTDRSGHIAYVGKVCRPADTTALESRLSEHVENMAKATTWAKLYVIPLKGDIPNVVVEYIEGLVGERLEPYQNDRLPNASRLAVAVEACGRGDISVGAEEARDRAPRPRFNAESREQERRL